MSKKIQIRLKEFRIKNNFTQIELARKLGVTDALIRNYESGKIIPPLEKIEKISEILDVSISELLGLNETCLGNFSLKDDIYLELLSELYKRLYRAKYNIEKDEEIIKNFIIINGLGCYKSMFEIDELEMLIDLMKKEEVTRCDNNES